MDAGAQRTADAIASAGGVRSSFDASGPEAVPVVLVRLRTLLREKRRLHDELMDVDAAIAVHLDQLREAEA